MYSFAQKTSKSGTTLRSSPQRTRFSEVSPAESRGEDASSVHSVEPSFRRSYSFGRMAIFPVSNPILQSRLAVHESGDVFEQEAERVAREATQPTGSRFGSPCHCGGTCSKCMRTGAALQTKRVTPSTHGAAAPPIVHEVLRSGGRPLESGACNLMEQRLGAEFSHVRVHTDAQAAASARAVHSLAYTVGRDIVFDTGRYAPSTNEGRHLLAHELTHVLQQSGNSPRSSLQRFEASERSKIAPTLNDMMNEIQMLVKHATESKWYGEQLNMNQLVEISGGYSAARRVSKATSQEMATIPSQMKPYRYLFTCRCGLVDMRHFMQLMYIANFKKNMDDASPILDIATGITKSPNDYATGKGREHEIEYEHLDPHSFFAPEDTPTNALGAYTGAEMAQSPSPDDVVDAIRKILTLCAPTDFGALSKGSQEKVVEYYGALVANPKRAGEMIPEHQNETARPAILEIPECGGGDRSYPFELEPDDPKTISGAAKSAPPTVKPLEKATLHVDIPPPNYDDALIRLLKPQFRKDDVKGYGQRVAKVKEFFQKMEPADARRLHDRLVARKTGDLVSHYFHHNLHHQTRSDLLKILDR